MGVVWFVKPDKGRVKSSSRDVLGLGKTGLVLRYGENALKIARVEDTVDLPEDERDMYEVLNEMNIDAMCNEIEIYKRLGSHPGLLQVYHLTENSIEMAVASRGSLATYIRTQDEPTDALKLSWINSVMSTMAYVHECSVIVDDVALRNFMIDDQFTIKLIDFGLSTLQPLGSNIANSIAAHLDIFRVGFVLYSIAAWKLYDYDDYRDENPESTSTRESASLQNPMNSEFEWPLVENLPSVEGCLYGDFIHNFWTGHYNTMDQLRKNIPRTVKPDASTDCHNTLMYARTWTSSCFEEQNFKQDSSPCISIPDI